MTEKSGIWQNMTTGMHAGGANAQHNGYFGTAFAQSISESPRKAIGQQTEL